MSYYVITSKRNKRALATKALDEAYRFIKANTADSKTRWMDNAGKVKLMDRRLFLKQFYKASDKSWASKIKVFEMANILIRNYNNRYDFLAFIGIKDDYLKYKKMMNKKL